MHASAPQMSLKSTHARYAARAAAELGYAFRSLDGADGYLFEVSDGARKALFAAGAGSPFAFNDARAASLARDKAFAATAMAEAGLPVSPHKMFFVTRRYAGMRHPGREAKDARAYAERAEYPLFCKPVSASSGEYAERIDSPAQFDDYLRRVAREHFAILIQPHLAGREHRVFVLDGEALFSYEKIRATARGDDCSSVRDLARAARREEWALPRSPRARDAEGRVYEPDDVPSAGTDIAFDGPANRAVGGGSGEVRDGAPEPLAKLAIAAANALGLRFAGIDMFDLSSAGDLSELCVIEANSNPMFKTLEDCGRWDLITRVWRANFDIALK
jgi:D-alanine-D-alanine ligase-like ATP-grasp enzyme